MSDNRQGFPWIPLVIGLIVGLVGGVYYAWYLNPVNLVDIAPRQLNAEDQQAYMVVVGEAYLQDHDLERARSRLAALGARDIAALVVSQANDAYLRGADWSEVRALTVLAEAFGANPLAADIFSGTVAPTSAIGTATPTFEAMPSPTASPIILTPTPLPIRPTVTPTPVLIPQGATLKLIANEQICRDDYPKSRIEVWVKNAEGYGIPAIQVLVEWPGGQDTFYTGLKLDINPGYADFQMEPNLVYTVTLVGLAEPVVGLDSHACLTLSGAVSTPTYQLIYEPVTAQP